MTDVTADQISAEAAQVKFLPWLGRTLRAILLGVFMTLGALAGSLWFGVVYCALAAKYGFLKGSHALPVAEAPRQPSLPQ